MKSTKLNDDLELEMNEIKKENVGFPLFFFFIDLFICLFIFGTPFHSFLFLFSTDKIQ